MEEKHCQATGHEHGQACCDGGAAPFILGVIVALVVGWWLVPKALFSEEHQPIRFSHKVHKESGMACQDCHSFSADGRFNGLPTTEKCAECHADVMGSDPEERKYVENYVRTKREVAWKPYQYQPDNVYFSHMAHNFARCTECHADLYKSEEKLCNQCHPDVADTDTPPPVFRNRLTDYTKQTMKMWECEKCHAIEDHRGSTNASNACFVCHK